MTVSYERTGHAAVRLARAASLAPSPHNSQPWSFVEEGHDHGFEVRVDGGRRMILTDPGGREAVIACGAALFNVRMAVRHLGFRPVVELLPRPGDSAFLARVGFGVHAPATETEAALIDAMPRRHTHRGPFASLALPRGLLDDLRGHARAEGAVLHVLEEPEELELMAELVRAAEDTHRADPGHTWEVRRNVGAGGVPVDACRFHPDATLLAGRDYLDLARRFIVPVRRRGLGTGTVVVLSTPHDGRADRVRAGQALQRVLLSAAARDVMAAFHTQPLELPETRARLRRRLAAGNHPQMVLRLGVPARTWTTARRPVSQVLVHDGASARW
ncbi:hypothetical protein ABZT17_33665 [Streptomyces sp. NPDC005648]|uniref:Acg family FMN-binding oxidoreductase n=1 Tax=Streptomyces sp. NPDC005648 TaxID=3157044 RepID=UPI0033B2CFA9